MAWFKKTNVSEFFLNEAHPYSRKRTIKIQHVGIVFAVLAVLVIGLSTVLEKRGEAERSQSQAAKDAKTGMNVSGNASAQSAHGDQGGYMTLHSTMSGRAGSGGSGRQYSASQIIKRGQSAGDVLPIGSQIQAQIVGRVESADSNSPVTAVVLSDALSPVQALVIPKGTKVIGSGQLDQQRERLQVRFHTLVFPEGQQYAISALATMPDGSSGLEGRFSSGAFKRNVSQFVGNFVSGLAQGMKDRTAVGQLGIPLESGSLKNGALNGLADASSNYTKSTAEKMGQTSASISVPSGVQFVLYLEREFHQ